MNKTRHRNKVRSLFFLALAVAACEDDSTQSLGDAGFHWLDGGEMNDAALQRDARIDGAPVTCDGFGRLAFDFFAYDPALEALRSCDVDADCDVVIGLIGCENSAASTSVCGVPIRPANMEAWTARVNAYEAEVCPRLAVPPGTGCASATGCIATEAHCVNKRCVATRRTSDAGL